jgi:hypothetical protein
MIDRELPVMATLALAVGLLLAIGINSFAGSNGSVGEELRPAVDRPASDVAALRLTPHPDRAPARRARRSATRHRAPGTAAVPTPAPARPPGQIPAASVREPGAGTPPGSSPAPRPAPKATPRPAPKPGGGGGGAAQPFDDSG